MIPPRPNPQSGIGMTADTPGEVASFPSVAKPRLKTNRLAKISWVILAGVFAAGIYSATTPSVLIIDEIAVPKDLLDDGYTPRLIAARLAIQIQMIRQAVNGNRRSIGPLPRDPTSEIVLPSVVSSVRRDIAFLRDLSLHPDIRIAGGLHRENGNLILTLLSKTADGRVLDYSGAPITDYHDIAVDGARSIVKFVDPYLLAAYYYGIETRAHDGDHAKSLALIADCLALTPPPDAVSEAAALATKVAANNLWGLVLLDQKNADAAVAKFGAALQLGRGDAELSRAAAYIQTNLAAALLDQKKTGEATDAVRKAIDLDPKYAPAYAGWGNILRDQKTPDEAIAKYQKAIELDAKYAVAYIDLGNALRDQKKSEAAVVAYRKAVELDATSAVADNAWGNALLDLKKPDEAIEKYQKAIELDPTYALAFNNWGVALRALKKSDEAIEKYQKAVALDPKSALAYNNWGNALRDLKKPAAALEKYRQAVEIDPTYALAYNNWGNALRDLRDPEASIEEIRKAVEVDPNSALAYNNWGNALLDLQKPEEAIEKYAKAVELDPSYALAYDGWGIALRDSGKPEAAVEKYAKAIEINPNYAPTYNSWGVALRDMKKPGEAIAMYEKAVALDPNYALAYNNWGNALLDQKKPEAAIEKYRKAVELDSEFSENLAVALRDVKRPK
jgi:tetratricopeptide (TPR) repeat protein